jgi:hypothetical protein
MQAMQAMQTMQAMQAMQAMQTMQTMQAMQIMQAMQTMRAMHTIKKNDSIHERYGSLFEPNPKSQLSGVNLKLRFSMKNIFNSKLPYSPFL